MAKNGARSVAEVFNVRIDGDNATADVTYSFEKTVDTTSGSELNVRREDGAWKVCESGAK